MLLSELLDLVDQKWWRDFLGFIETGDASDDFLEYLDSDSQCQKAVEAALDIQAAGLKRASQVIRSDHAAAVGTSRSDVDAKSAKIAQALEEAADLPASRRREVVRQAVAAARRSVGIDNTPALRSVVAELEKELTSA